MKLGTSPQKKISVASPWVLLTQDFPTQLFRTFFINKKTSCLEATCFFSGKASMGSAGGPPTGLDHLPTPVR